MRLAFLLPAAALALAGCSERASDVEPASEATETAPDATTTEMAPVAPVAPPGPVGVAAPSTDPHAP